MTPEQLIAEVEALLPSGPDQVVTKFYKWRGLAPLVVDALKSMQAALERLTAEREDLRAQLTAREEECRELESRRLLAYRAYCDVSRRLDEEERERKEDRARAMARIAELESALATLRAAQTPRPIAEAPKDGTWVRLYWDEEAIPDIGAFTRWDVGRFIDGAWQGDDGGGFVEPSHFLPLPVKP